jgi:hypothetical protein
MTSPFRGGCSRADTRLYTGRLRLELRATENRLCGQNTKQRYSTFGLCHKRPIKIRYPTCNRAHAGVTIALRLKREIANIWIHPSRPCFRGEQPLPRPVAQHPVRCSERGREQVVTDYVERRAWPRASQVRGCAQRSLCDCFVVATTTGICYASRLVIGSNRIPEQT